MENQKKLGFFNLLTMSIGYIVGSGIFAMLPSVIGMTGRSVCLAMVFGALVITFATTVPAIFGASTLDLPGGQYSLGIALMPQGLAGIYGIMTITVSLTFCGSIVSLAAYVIQLLPGLAGAQKIISFILLLLFFAMGVRGMSLSAKFQDIAVIILLIALGIYIFGGLPNVEPGFFASEGFFTGGVAGFLSASAFLSLSASGGAALLGFTSAAKNPKRDIPLAMGVGTVLVVVLYFLVAVVTAGILPIEEVAGQTLGVVADTFMSRPLYMFFMFGGAMFALGTTVNSQLASLPFPILRMAEDGWLPKAFLKRDSKLNYPYVVMGFAFIVGGIIPIVSGWDITTIVSLFGVPTFAFGAVLGIYTLRLPKKYAKRWENATFRIPLPVFYVLIVLSIVSSVFLTYEMAAYLDLQSFIVVMIIMAVICAYIFWRWKAGYVNVDYIEEMLKDDSAK